MDGSVSVVVRAAAEGVDDAAVEALRGALAARGVRLELTGAGAPGLDAILVPAGGRVPEPAASGPVPLLPVPGGEGDLAGWAESAAERLAAAARMAPAGEDLGDLVEHAADLMCLHRLDGTVVWANAASARMLGVPLERVLRGRIQEILPPEDRDGYERYVAELLERGEASGTMRVVTPGGDVRIWAYRNTLRRREGEEPLVRALATDVTEAWRARRELERTTARYEGLLDAIDAVLWEASPDGSAMRYVSPAAERLFGRPARALLEDPSLWRRVVHPEDRERVERESARLARGEEVRLEYRIVRPDGEVRWIVDAKGPLRDGAGRVTGIGGIALDITPAREATERAEQLAAALAAIGEGVCISDPDDIIQWVNPAFCEIFGYAEEELLEQPIEIVRVPDFDPETAREIRRATLAGGWRGEVRNRRKDGREIRVLLTTAPVRDAAGNVVALIGVSRDVTAEREAEARLREAQKMEAVGRLAAGVAHDFNNLLQAILGAVQLAQLRLGDPLAPLAEEVRRHVERGAALTRQLLLFSRKEPGRREVVDLTGLVRRTLELLARLLPEDVRVEVETPAAPVQVEADPGQLEQVLTNLALNARDAMPDGGELSIAVRSRPGEAVVEVADTGCGMPPEVLARIFEPFFTTKEVGRGSGLGLAVVHGIVTDHGGRVEVESEPGRGSTFRVVLPAAAAAPAAEPGGAPGPLPRGRGERVLLVEDEDGVREPLAELLKALGYRVTAVGGAGAARAAAEGAAFDLLVADCRLSDGAGAALAEELRARRPGLRTVLISGYAEEDVLPREAREAADAFLPKPFDLAAVARAMAEALGRGG